MGGNLLPVAELEAGDDSAARSRIRAALALSVRSAGDDFNYSLSLRFQSLRSGCSQMVFLVRAHSCFVS